MTHIYNDAYYPHQIVILDGQLTPPNSHRVIACFVELNASENSTALCSIYSASFVSSIDRTYLMRCIRLTTQKSGISIYILSYRICARRGAMINYISHFNHSYQALLESRRHSMDEFLLGNENKMSRWTCTHTLVALFIARGYLSHICLHTNINLNILNP